VDTFGKILGTLIAWAWALALIAAAVLWFGSIPGSEEFLASGWGKALLVFGPGLLIAGLYALGCFVVVSYIEDEGWKATFALMGGALIIGVLATGVTESMLKTNGWTSGLWWLVGRLGLVLGVLVVACFPVGASIALVRSWLRRRGSV
jgi:hypothetical protein